MSERRPAHESASFREDAWRSGAPGGPDRVEPYHATVTDALAEAARLEERTGMSILPRNERHPEIHLSYRDLYQKARRMAAGLRARGVEAGDRVLLVIADPDDFLAAFFGVQLLRALPVPAYPPAGFRVEAGLTRLAHIAEDAATEVCVTSALLLPIVGDLGLRAPCVARIVTVSDVADAEPLPDGLQARPDDVAFLQYTSGSTGRPKGVMVSHENLVCNVHSIGQAVQVTRDDGLVSWCPLYHDMGLIGGPIFCLYWRIPIAILSPVSFLRSPGRWLRAIHDHRATLSPAPNFGFALAVRRVPEAEREGLDLSTWRVALNGAEAVNPTTVEEFIEAYEPHGFRASAMMPVYGLAEATLAVTFTPLDTGVRSESLDRGALARGRAAPAPGGRRVVSVGQPIPGQRVRVVDEEGHPLPERRVGEVQAAGPSIMRGYFGDAGASAEVRDGPWLCTGDLGYMADSELFLTGRAKDLIILQGRNYHAEDLERSAERLEGVRGGASVAFSVYDETAARERVVLVSETRIEDPSGRARLAEALRTRVQEETTLALDDVVLVDRGTVPKTSSGKRQRSRCRERYLEGRLRPRRTGKLRLAVLALRSALGFLTLWSRRLFGGGER